MTTILRKMPSYIFQYIIILVLFILSIYAHRKMNLERPRLWTIVVLLIFCGLSSLTVSGQIQTVEWTSCETKPHCEHSKGTIIMSRVGQYVSCAGLILLIYFMVKVVVPKYY